MKKKTGGKEPTQRKMRLLCNIITVGLIALYIYIILAQGFLRANMIFPTPGFFINGIMPLIGLSLIFFMRKKQKWPFVVLLIFIVLKTLWAITYMLFLLGVPLNYILLALIKELGLIILELFLVVLLYILATKQETRNTSNKKQKAVSKRNAELYFKIVPFFFYWYFGIRLLLIPYLISTSFELDFFYILGMIVDAGLMAFGIYAAYRMQKREKWALIAIALILVFQIIIMLLGSISLNSLKAPLIQILALLFTLIGFRYITHEA